MRLSVRSIAVVVMGCGCIGAAAITGACIIAPPPDLPPVTSHRPTILHGSVDPSADLLLRVWPSVFIVPVEFVDTHSSFAWSAFVDWDGASQQPTLIGAYPPAPPEPSALDGGVMMLSVTLDPPSDLSRCHTIEVRVAHDFLRETNGTIAFHTFDDIGGDNVVWQYVGPAGSNGCLEYSFDSGSQDASSEILPIPVTEAGGNP
jgi:hypothetical protein